MIDDITLLKNPMLKITPSDNSDGVRPTFYTILSYDGTTDIVKVYDCDLDVEFTVSLTELIGKNAVEVMPALDVNEQDERLNIISDGFMTEHKKNKPKTSRRPTLTYDEINFTYTKK